MTDHTPGPWRLRRGDEAPDDFIVMDEEGASVADCSPGNPYMSQGEGVANARLIAAAPELLEACKALLKDVEHYLGPCMSGGKMTQARAAIAKSEGK